MGSNLGAPGGPTNHFLVYLFGSWDQLGPSWPTWANLGQLGANLGPTWVQLGPTWANLGPTSATLGQFRLTWDPLGVNLCHLVPKWGMGNVKNQCFPLFCHIFLKCRPSCPLKANLDQHVSTWDKFDANLNPCCFQFVPIWLQLGASCTQVGAKLAQVYPK